MSEEPFILLDRASRNILGEFESLDDARTDRLEWVDAASDAEENLEIWHGDAQDPIDPESLQPSPAA